MRILLAGATGVIGSRLVPLLVGAGHDVTGMTRSPGKAAALEQLGAQPAVCDVFDAAAVTAVVARSEPALVVHQLTDLPDEADRVGDFLPLNNRIRREGTRNLLTAAAAAGVDRFAAQSVAWQLEGEGGEAVSDLERMVLAYPGVVLRYGRFYGPGTYYPGELPPSPRIHIDEAAARTVASLFAHPGVMAITED